MKRKAKFIPHKRDRNLERVQLAGYAARLNEKPSTACPNLTLLFEERYATVLMDEWMRGWYAADRKLRQPRLEMKGSGLMERGPMRIASDDPELFDWLRNVMKHGGGFLRSIGDAGFRADAANYEILRPALLELKTKYPKYAKQGEDLAAR